MTKSPGHLDDTDALQIYQRQGALAAALGALIMGWNGVETNLRWLVDSLAGGGRIGEILISRMSVLELCDVAQILCSEAHSAKHLAEIKAVTKCVDRLRAYRNYYAHEVSAVTIERQSEHVAVAFGRSSKNGAYKRRVSGVTLEELNTAVAAAGEIQGYLGVLGMQFVRFEPEDRRPSLPPIVPSPLPRLDVPWRDDFSGLA